MALNIKMYNTWFGDCFRLENDISNLWVDFGIHAKSSIPNGYNRDSIHEAISKDIVASKESKLLITHFHDDHISGLLYMLKYKSISKSPLFEKVYIPDIWDFPSSPAIIATLLFEELVKHYRISGKKNSVTLFDFMRFLCNGTKNVIPLKRGAIFENNQYITLWPDPQHITSFNRVYLSNLEISVFPPTLQNIAVKFQSIVLETFNRSKSSINEEMINSKINSLETDFLSLLNDEGIFSIINKNSIIDEYSLNKLGNNISIVFQNSSFTQKENILFTGDIENKFLEVIVNNYDKKCDVYPEYQYIKIPHHGTKGSRGEYYFDFKPYNPQNYLISNGRVEGVNGNWEVCNEYSRDVNSNGIRVICSNSNFCLSNTERRFSTCSCTNRTFVFPKCFIYVK